jgi:hypothetical protein
VSEFVKKTVGKIAVPVAVFCSVALSAFLLAQYVFAEKFANDFGVYWRAANQPLGEVYFWQGRFPFPYPPTMLLWIQPLALVAKWPAYFLFLAVSLGAFILAFRPYISKWAMGLALISPPFARGMFTGQVCAVLSAALLWACSSKNRIAAGIALGIIASIKPQLVLMAPLMLALNRDWRAFIAAGASFATIILLSLALFGPERWPEWWASMGHFQQAVTGTGVIGVGVTPAMWAERHELSPILFMLLGTIGGAVTIWFCRDSDPLEKTAAIVTASLLSAPYALVYDLTAIVPYLAMLTLRGNVLGALAVASPLHPLPLLLSTCELVRTKLRLTVKGLRDASL